MVEELVATHRSPTSSSDARVVDGFGGYAHATSTCAMGIVVDEHGAVIGYDNLFVADASVLPTRRLGMYASRSSPSASPAWRRLARRSRARHRDVDGMPLIAQVRVSSSAMLSWSRSVISQTSGTRSRSQTNPKSRLPL